MHGQLPAVFSVREREKLLEQLRVEDGHQEVETGVVVGYDCEQGHLALPERRQVELVCGGERRQGVEVELLQPGGERHLDGFERLGRAGAVAAVVFERDVARVLISSRSNSSSSTEA